ncbi:hypothetical protein LCGC14_1975710, partial [marine sediment metagenome]
MGLKVKRFARTGLWLTALTAVAAGSGCVRSSKQLQLDPTRAYVDARTVLRQAAEDPDPRVRTNALEALAVTEGAKAGAIYLQLLGDERLPVVSAAAMAVGECRYDKAMPMLLAYVKDERTSPKLKCSVIYALHRLGNDAFTGQFAELLQNKDKFVRAEAARIMGRMGEPSAIGPLKSLQRDDREVVVRLNVAEALAMLGDRANISLKPAAGPKAPAGADNKRLLYQAMAWADEQYHR